MELYNELEFQIIKSSIGSFSSEEAIDNVMAVDVLDTETILLYRDTLDEFVKQFKELTNLNILKQEYGIDIPDHDLVITVDSTQSELVPQALTFNTRTKSNNDYNN